MAAQGKQKGMKIKAKKNKNLPDSNTDVAGKFSKFLGDLRKKKLTIKKKGNK